MCRCGWDNCGNTWGRQDMSMVGAVLSERALCRELRYTVAGEV